MPAGRPCCGCGFAGDSQGKVPGRREFSRHGLPGEIEAAFSDVWHVMCACNDRMKLLLAVDLSECSSSAIDAVLTQFDPKTTEVRVFHATDWEQEVPPSYLFAQGKNAAKSLLHERDKILRDVAVHMTSLERLFNAAGFAASAELDTKESPSQAILNAARAWPADLIVMGSHGRSGLNRWLLGSVAEGVMRQAPCSVQIVRPAARTAQFCDERSGKQNVQ